MGFRARVGGMFRNFGRLITGKGGARQPQEPPTPKGTGKLGPSDNYGGSWWISRLPPGVLDRSILGSGGRSSGFGGPLSGGPFGGGPFGSGPFGGLPLPPQPPFGAPPPVHREGGPPRLGDGPPVPAEGGARGGGATLQAQVTSAFAHGPLRNQINALLPAAGPARDNIINAIPAAGAILPGNINGILTANGNAVRNFLTTLHGDVIFQPRLTAAITAAVPGAGDAVEQRREELRNHINNALQDPAAFLVANPRLSNTIFPIIFRAIRP